MTAAAVIQERRAREYETIFIMRANADTKQAEKVLDRIRDVIGGREAKLLEIDNWGRRKLAYEIEKASRGVFVYVRFAGYEDLVRELERNLGLLDEVLRFQTVLISPRVDLSAYEVEDDSVQFGELEPADDDEEPGLAQRLGLVERPKPEYSADDGRSGSADADDDDDGDEAKSSDDSGDAGSKEAGSKEAGSKEAGSKEAGSKEAGSKKGASDEADSKGDSDEEAES